jgi:hypothetical protein
MLKVLLAAALVPALAAGGYYLVQDYRAAEASKAYRKAVMEQAHTEYQARKERRGKMDVDGALLDQFSVGTTVNNPSR